MLSEEDTLFADDIKAEGLGRRVVKGLGVVLAVVRSRGGRISLHLLQSRSQLSASR